MSGSGLDINSFAGVFIDHLEIATALSPAVRVQVGADLSDPKAPGGGKGGIGARLSSSFRKALAPTVTAYAADGSVVYQWAPYGESRGSWIGAVVVVGSLVGLGFYFGRISK